MEISRKTLADTTFSMERNLLDHIISTYLGDSTDEDAISLLLLPAAARHVVKHLQAEKAWIVTSYETQDMDFVNLTSVRNYLRIRLMNY